MAAATVVVGAASPPAAGGEYLDRLDEAPPDGGIYILGNSMFFTAVDVAAVDAAFPAHDVAFEYHGGHYTSLWYLVATSALAEPEARPRLVVWGFRPAFARIPAFRQNEVTAIERFLPGDAEYQRLAAAGAADAARPARYGSSRRWLLESARYETFEEWLVRFAERVGVDPEAVAGAGAPTWEALAAADAFAAGAAAVLAGRAEPVGNDELVPGLGTFVIGPQAAFADGFVPRTALAIADAGHPQLMVLWRPATAVNGRPVPADRRFVADARRWASAHQVPLLDLYDDSRILPEHLGSGDHYNEEGRRVATEVLIAALADLLGGDAGCGGDRLVAC